VVFARADFVNVLHRKGVRLQEYFKRLTEQFSTSILWAAQFSRTLSRAFESRPYDNDARVSPKTAQTGAPVNTKSTPTPSKAGQ
jgi:hypothetical protein